MAEINKGKINYTKATNFIHKYSNGKEMNDEYYEVIKDIMDQVLQSCHKKTMAILQMRMKVK